MYKELPNDLQQQIDFYLHCNQFLKAKELIASYHAQSANSNQNMNNL